MEQDPTQDTFLRSFDEYSDAIFRFCMVKTGNKELSEDLTQETFMRYWQALCGGRRMTNTRAFLYTIANHRIIDWYRKKKPDSLDERIEAGHEPVDPHDPDERAAERYEFDGVLVVMHQLDPRDRDVLLLRYVEGMDPIEIADILEESANVISVRIHRAMKRLKAKLNHG